MGPVTILNGNCNKAILTRMFIVSNGGARSGCVYSRYLQRQIYSSSFHSKQNFNCWRYLRYMFARHDQRLRHTEKDTSHLPTSLNTKYGGNDNFFREMELGVLFLLSDKDNICSTEKSQRVEENFCLINKKLLYASFTVMTNSKGLLYRRETLPLPERQIWWILIYKR